MEKNCIWHFGKEGGIDIGPNDPIHQTFKGNPFYSIVREAIQNSLDAVNDDKFPVKISFQYFELDRFLFPSFFQLEEHINLALKFYGTNGDAKKLFGDMLKYLNGTENGIKNQRVSCLKISDSNTKGMHYAEGTESPFYAFLRAAGVSSKNLSGSGGSFGFGKGAYFALSPIKTLIVSSKDESGNVFFEGATRLTTHKNDNDAKLTAYGFYDNNNGEPVLIEDNIPDIFKRSETGTDINIIGLWDEANQKRLMIKSVLNNFWLSIHESKLIVTIDDVIISKENLEQVIDVYFPNDYESGNTTDIELWNPKPYFKAVKYAGVNDQFQFFTEDLNNLGKVKMYVYLQKGLPNRTSLFRMPKMVVTKKGSRVINGYAAVFVCDDVKGNGILRMMENPAHNEWKKENYPKHEGKIPKEPIEAEYSFTNYINRTLQSLSKVNLNKKIAFLGLEEFLSIPQDLLEKDDNSDLSGDNTNNNSGLPSKLLTSDETGLQTTNRLEPISIKPTIREQSKIKEEGETDLADDGEEIATAGGNNTSSGGDQPGSSDGGNKETGKETIESKYPRVLVNVRLKVAAQKEQNIFYHNLIVSVDKDIKNAELELLVGSDNDKDDGIAINSTNKGIIQSNKLKNVELFSGRNQIKIRFADNIKHSIKIRAYEVQ